MKLSYFLCLFLFSSLLAMNSNNDRYHRKQHQITQYNPHSTRALKDLLQNNEKFQNKAYKIRSLLEQGANPNISFIEQDGEKTLLAKTLEYTRETQTYMEFTQERASELLELLVQKGVDPNEVATLIASDWHQPKKQPSTLVDLLIEKGISQDNLKLITRKSKM